MGATDDRLHRFKFRFVARRKHHHKTHRIMALRDQVMALAPAGIDDGLRVCGIQLQMHAAIVRMGMDVGEFAPDHEGFVIARRPVMQDQGTGARHGNPAFFIVHIGQRKTPFVQLVDYLVRSVLGQLRVRQAAGGIGLWSPAVWQAQ